MKKISVTAIAMVTAVAGFGLLPSTAGAAESEITVIAPYTVHRQVEGRSATGAEIETVSLSRTVSYADLDLTQPLAFRELESRINRVARQACSDLKRMYPDGAISSPNSADTTCISNAVKGGMDRANLIVASLPRR